METNDNLEKNIDSKKELEKDKEDLQNLHNNYYRNIGTDKN